MALTKILQAWRREVNYFERNKSNIEKKYGRDTYIVIYNQKIVDFGQDKSSLIRKYDSLKKSHIVTSINDGEMVHEIHSPRILSQ